MRPVLHMGGCPHLEGLWLLLLNLPLLHSHAEQVTVDLGGQELSSTAGTTLEVQKGVPVQQRPVVRACPAHSRA